MTALSEIWFPPFAPFPGLAGPHRMTVAATFRRPSLTPFRERSQEELLETEPGTRVRLRHNRQERDGRPAALFVHGLLGHSDSDYVVGAASKASAAGFHAARIDLPNSGGTEELTERTYEGGRTIDVLRAAEALVGAHGAPQVTLVGFSLGGNTVLRLAAELGGSAPWLRAVIAVSPAVDFALLAERLHATVATRMYERRFVAGLLAIARRREALHPGHADLARLGAAPSIRRFDELYTAPQAGYESVDDYYARASSLPVLDRIRVPTLVIASRDDPLVPHRLFEQPVFQQHEHVRLLSTRRGGHLGFLARSCSRTAMWFDPDRRWAENRIPQCLLELERSL